MVSRCWLFGMGLTLVRVDPLWLQGVYGLIILAAITIDAFVARASHHKKAGVVNVRGK